MTGLIILLLALGSSCDRGDIFRIDGDATRDGELAIFQKMEGVLGLDHSLGSSLITAIERQGKIALARRLGIEVMEHELRASFRKHVRAAQKPHKMAEVLRRFGEDAYIRWFMAPQLATQKLESLFNREVDDWVRGRATRILKNLLGGSQTVAQVKQSLRPDSRYVRFRLSPNDMLQHKGGGARLGYLEDIEAYQNGELPRHPKMPKSPMDVVDGLGLGEPGYVKGLSDILSTVVDGRFLRHVVRDKEQWLVLRRLAKNTGVYEVDGFAIRVPPFPDWLNKRFRELKLTMCSSVAAKAARTLAPDNPIVELMK